MATMPAGKIQELHAPEASAVVRPWVMPPKLVVSTGTRRLLLELLAEEDDEEIATAPVADFAAFRARKQSR